MKRFLCLLLRDRLVQLFLLCIVLWIFYVTVVEGAVPTSAVERAKKATCVVGEVVNKEIVGWGCGVFIAAQGKYYVVTAGHVATGPNNQSLAIIQGEDQIPLTVVQIWPERDVALLSPPSDYRPASVVQFVSEKPTVGEDVYAVGAVVACPKCPELPEMFVSAGVVARVGHVSCGREHDDVTAISGPGASGGGVFNSKGYCIGLVVCGAITDWTRCIPSRIVLMCLEEVKLVKFPEQKPAPCKGGSCPLR